MQLIKEKLNAGQYNIDLAKDEGEIVEIDDERYGAYRDINGKLHIVDITCTHMGCELKWNSAEKSWDCPCHGSRVNSTNTFMKLTNKLTELVNKRMKETS